MSSRPASVTEEQEKNIRKGWKVGDWLEVFSKSRNEWFRAKVIEIYKDEDGEWLAVVVENTMIKEVQRYNDDVRPIYNNDDDNDGSSSEISETESDSGSDSDSTDYETSDDDENNVNNNSEDKKKKKQKKMKKAQSKHHEMNVIFVENSGTEICRGKYTYLTTSEAGYPAFAKVNKQSMQIKYNEDEFRWEFVYKTDVYYIISKDSEFPPNFGWIKRKGIFPVPSVRIEQLKNKIKDDVFFEDDPYKFSPFLILKHQFNVVDHNDLGFKLHEIQLHAQFVGIKSIKSGTQAANFGLQAGDVLVSVETEDLSKIKFADKAQKIVKQCINDVKSKKEKHLTFTFAREKNQFKVIMVQRGGTSKVNGKYSPMDQENDALCFANNSNINMRILRIYVNEDDDEAIWAVREVNVVNPKKKNNNNNNNNNNNSESKENGSNNQKKKPKVIKTMSNSSEVTDDDDDDDDDENHKDYYIVLTSAKDEFPPECGWEAVGDGIWPAPGLTYYDVNLIQPDAPKITRCQPNPSAVQIHFECDEEKRKPKVCPHMRTWYEIEMRHYQPIPDTNKVKIQTKIWEIEESPFVANKLTNGDEYSFIVRTCNVISSANSEMSKKVIPLQLPPKPKITDITGKPNELYIHFHCPNAKDRDVQAKFEIIVDPPIDPLSQIYKIKDHRLLVDNDNEPVRLKNLINGKTYRMIVASVNTVGVTYSEPEMAYPSKEPPQPHLTSVEGGNREIIVNFKCDGYDRPDTLAWFEVELDPPPPKLISDIKTEQENKKKQETNGNSTNNNNIDDEKEHKTKHIRDKSIRFKQKLARKSRWRRQTTTKKMLSMGLLGGYPGAGLGIKSNDDEKINLGKLLEQESDDFIPYFRREKRHAASPIKITPVVNGISYIVRIKAVTLSGQKITSFSQAIKPKGPPPMPKIVKVTPKESAVEINFECDDYATEEYKAKYEIESLPNTVTHKCKISPAIFPGLNNGWNYKFQIRAVNKEGKSKWSDRSQQVTPLKVPPTPTDLFPVSYDREITIYWVCEELKTPEYSGWYEVNTEPPTYTMVVTRAQARFRRLDNDKEYTFTVSAVNQVGRSISQACNGTPRENIKKDSYLREKKRVACVVRDLVLKYRKERKKKRAQENSQQRANKIAKFRDLDKKKSRQAQLKKLDKKKRKKEAERRREDKKNRERESRKKKMEEQRAKVLANKRRISFLHRQRIDNLQTQMSRRGGNKNTALGLFSNKKKGLKIKAKANRASKKKSSKQNTPIFHNNNSKTSSGKSTPRDRARKKKRSNKGTPTPNNNINDGDNTPTNGNHKKRSKSKSKKKKSQV